MTSYDEIYNRFLGKIDDYDLLHELGEDGEGKDFVKSLLLDYMTGAISLYTYQTGSLNNRDDNKEKFDDTLDDMEQEILSMFMVVEYLSSKIIRSNLIEQRFSSKDLREFSPAKLLAELRGIQTELYNKAHGLMTEKFIRAGL